MKSFLRFYPPVLGLAFLLFCNGLVLDLPLVRGQRTEAVSTNPAFKNSAKPPLLLASRKNKNILASDSNNAGSLENPETFPPAVAPVSRLTANESPWGTYQAGTWVQSRIITTSFQEDKSTRSVSESKTIVDSVDPEAVALKQSIAVEMNGKLVFGDPQTKKYDYFQQPLAEGVLVSVLPTAKLTVGGKVFTCELRSYEQTTPQWKRKTTVWYNTTIAPFVLRTETIKTTVPTAEQPEEKVLSHTVASVLYPPAFTLRGILFGAYQVRTVKKNTEGTTITLANCSQRIPGSLKNEQSWEYDRNGKLIRTIETYVTSYAYTRSSDLACIAVPLVEK